MARIPSRFACAVLAVVGGCILHHAASQIRGNKSHNKPEKSARQQKKAGRSRKPATPNAAESAAAQQQDSHAMLPSPSQPTITTTNKTNNKPNNITKPTTNDSKPTTIANTVIVEACSEEALSTPTTPTSPANKPSSSSSFWPTTTYSDLWAGFAPSCITATFHLWAKSCCATTTTFTNKLWPYRAEFVAATLFLAFAAAAAVIVTHNMPWAVLGLSIATTPVSAWLDAWRFDVSVEQQQQQQQGPVITAPASPPVMAA